ncbi:Ig-like domain-containing protein [Paenibacillus sp. CC-CFT747]|nr:Ig-like domain-containing protein [Paenibacillus sp. CC-CFT747]
MYHLALDKSGTKVWASGIPGVLIDFPLEPFGKGTYHSIKGDEDYITSIAFDSLGNAYYTSSGSGGNGTFGTIDLDTFTTKRLMKDIPAAHGMFYDVYTGDLILVGDDQIAQIDPETRTLVSERIFPGRIFDQGAADGKGHILVADNNGYLLFLDYSYSKLVGDRHNYATTPYVESCLDDVAPLSGFGSAPPAQVLLNPAAAEREVGATHELSATVKDAKGNTMAGMPLTLEVTGANPGVYTAVTGTDGSAVFRYTGNNAGDDTLIARTVKIQSDPAAVKWLPADKTPPVTEAAVNPAAPNGTNGWYVTDASVTLTATDNSSGVAKTEYRINSGSWADYSGAIPVTAEERQLSGSAARTRKGTLRKRSPSPSSWIKASRQPPLL